MTCICMCSIDKTVCDNIAPIKPLQCAVELLSKGLSL